MHETDVCNLVQIKENTKRKVHLEDVRVTDVSPGRKM